MCMSMKCNNSFYYLSLNSYYISKWESYRDIALPTNFDSIGYGRNRLSIAVETCI